MEEKKKEVETREVIVHDLTKARTFELKGEAGFKIKSLKQKVSDVEFKNGETSITATATTFRLATELGSDGGCALLAAVAQQTAAGNLLRGRRFHGVHLEAGRACDPEGEAGLCRQVPRYGSGRDGDL